MRVLQWLLKKSTTIMRPMSVGIVMVIKKPAFITKPMSMGIAMVIRN
jgi:hypothetical protein